MRAFCHIRYSAPSKSQVPDKKVALQNLDDFDGMAPPPEPKVDNEPGTLHPCVCVNGLVGANRHFVFVLLECFCSPCRLVPGVSLMHLSHTDFFSDLGLQPTYVKPEIYAAAPKKKTLQMVLALLIHFGLSPLLPLVPSHSF